MRENPVKCKYACTRALLHMLVLKKGAYQSQNTKINSFQRFAFFLQKKWCHTNLCYTENRSIYLFFMSICEGDPNPL